VSGAAEPVGAVVHALAVADGLQALGHDAEVWAPEEARAALEGAERARVHPVPVPGGGGVDPEDRARVAIAALSGALAAGEPADVEHAQDAIAGAALLWLRAERGAGAVVRTVHHVDASGLPELDETERASIQGADACICASAFWADRIRAEYGVEATVVPGGVDAGRFASPLGRAEAGHRFGWGARPTVLALGGISRRKGSRVLLEAFARARLRLGEDGLLAIAGDAASAGEGGDFARRWRDDAERLGLEIAGPLPGPGASVALLGRVPSAEMPTLYQAADALAYPSTREGFGLAVLEAATAGLPAVVSDLPVLREVLEDGRDCLMVPAGHSAPLADALVRLVRDEGLRATLVAGGRETAGRYRWADAAEAHLRVYEGLAAAR
jgi:glycosyltransferase-like protein